MNIIEADSDRLLGALRTVLARKGIAPPAEIAERIAVTDRASPAMGARMVAKAWTDPAFRTLLLEDGTRAAESLGIMMRGAPPLGVLENTPRFITSSFARCAVATRARCWAIRRSGSNRPHTGRVPCATRAV